MSKYAPLTHHLASRRVAHVPMTFKELENLLGFQLPPSSRKHRAWWSNNPSNNVMTKAWVSAGYRTEDVDIEKERLVFQKINSTSGAATDEATRPMLGPKRHPLFGAFKGTITIQEGYDLTEPADPEWGNVYK